MSNSKFSPKIIKQQALQILGKAQSYGLLIFVLFVGIVYASILLKTNSLINGGSDTGDETSQVSSNKIPKIDDDVVQKLQSLKDNSVSVQSLFDDARSNPFQ